jgi:hypothetical protein
LPSPQLFYRDRLVYSISLGATHAVLLQYVIELHIDKTFPLNFAVNSLKEAIQQYHRALPLRRPHMPRCNRADQRFEVFVIVAVCGHLAVFADGY